MKEIYIVMNEDNYIESIFQNEENAKDFCINHYELTREEFETMNWDRYECGVGIIKRMIEDAN